MANGIQLWKAWQEWLVSDAGEVASNPRTLPSTPSARNYLENRLWAAFMAGVKAAKEPHA